MTKLYIPTRNQQLLWIGQQVWKDRPIFNEAWLYIIRGPVDPEHFARAIDAVSQRTDTMRSVLLEELGEPRVCVLENPTGSFQYVDLSTSDNASAGLDSWASRHASRSFDLTRQWYEHALVKLGDEQFAWYFGQHHIFTDVGSIELTFRRVAECYQKSLAGTLQELPSYPDLRDYLEKMADYQASPQWRDSATYWSRKLENSPAPLSFCGHTSLPKDTAMTVARVHFELGQQRSARVRHFLTHDGASKGSANRAMFSLFTAILAATLYHLTRCKRLAIGVPYHNRGRRAGDVIGFLVEQDPLHLEFDDTTSFAQLRSLVEAELDGLIRHTPYAAGNPQGRAFQVALNLVGSKFTEFAGCPVETLWRYVGFRAESLMVSIHDFIDTGSLTAEFDFNTEIFPADYRHEVINIFASMLDACLLDPELSLRAAMPGVTGHAPSAVSERPGATPPTLLPVDTAEPDFACLPTLVEWFESQVERYSERPAVSFGGETMTYGELNARANQLAYMLRALGVGPESLVALHLPRTAELVVGILGTLKAGGAYLPLDPSYPAERLAVLLEDSQPAVVVTAGSSPTGRPAFSGPLVDLVGNRTVLDAGPTNNLGVVFSADSLAYVIYTSGSTGRPKGVLVTHGNVVRLFKATEAWFHFNERDVWTLFHSYAFDFSVWELWGALLYGGRLVVVSFETSRSPEAFRELLATERITVLNQTPSAFRQLIHADKRSTSALALRYVVFGGEALDLGMLRPWVERYGDSDPCLINMYGITETTVHVTYRALARADIEANKGSVIGIPIPDLEMHLIDESGNPVAQGTPGEIFVAGAGLARGYLNRAELTAQRFVIRDIGGVRRRLYRTGDLAVLRPDGDYEYHGRIDNQVKIRGFRIELGEIEVAIRAAVPGIKDAVVAARKRDDGEPALAAYIVSSDEELPSATELRNALLRQLPAYMVPAAFVFIDAVPLTPNGKVDRKALPDPEEQRPELATEYRAPASPAEAVLADVYCRVLRIDRVGTADDFFALGGDSILILRVIVEARRAGLNLTPADLFAGPTVAELARAAAGRELESTEQILVDEAPLSPIQRWFVEQRFEQPNHWNQSLLLESPQALDADTARKAFVELARRHDALRTRLVLSGEQPAQRLGDPESSVLLESIGTVDEHGFAAAASGAQASLDLECGPLLSAVIAGVKQRHLLLIVVHHWAVDAVSWRILREDFEAIYEALDRGANGAKSQTQTSFLAWCAGLSDQVESGAFAADAGNWARILDGDRSNMSVTGPASRPAEFKEEGACTLTAALSAEETTVLLRTLPGTTRTQINDLLLGAFSKALAPLFNRQDEVLIELEGHGREDLIPGLDPSRTVGWFTAIFPFRLPLVGGDLFEAVRAVKNGLQQLPRRRATFGLACRQLAMPMQAAGATASILFNYLGQTDDVTAGSKRFRLAPDSVGAPRGPGNHRTHELECVLMVQDGQLRIALTFCPSVNSEETAARLMDGFTQALRALVSRDAGAAPLLTHGDFQLSGVTRDSFELLLSRCPELDDVLPLSPVQILYYSLDGTDGDIGLDQFHYTLDGPLELGAFRSAWRAAVNRHSILRGCFLRDVNGKPFQVLLKRVEPTWKELDWSDVAPSEFEDRFQKSLLQDREVAFDLGEPPLTRIAVIARSKHEHRVVWTHHHLQIDGWSWPLLLSDVASNYASLVTSGREVPSQSTASYKAYLRWLSQRDMRASEDYWQQTLAGIDTPTPLPGLRRVGKTGLPVGERFGEFLQIIGAGSVRTLRELARRERLTVNALVQTAWTLLLYEANDRDDLVFGAAFAGRPSELHEVDCVIGPFVNNLPLRVKVSRDMTIRDLGLHVHGILKMASLHQDVPLQRIHELSEITGGRRMFESLLVFQNYDVPPSCLQLHGGTFMRSFVAPVRTSYPFTLLVQPADEFTLTGINDRSRLPDDLAGAMVQRLTRFLSQMPSAFDVTVATFLARQGNVTWPAPENDAQAARSTSPPPRAGLEERIARAWQEILGVDHVGRDDNFLELGGQSLAMVQLHTKLVSELAIDITIARMFQFPTVAALAEFIESERGGHRNGGADLRGRMQRAAAAARKRRHLS